jgi:hypothetical protein
VVLVPVNFSEFFFFFGLCRCLVLFGRFVDKSFKILDKINGKSWTKTS